MKFKHIALAAIATASIFLQACTTSTNDGINEPSYSDFEDLPLNLRETYVTNYLLNIFYVNADKELKSADAYVMEGEDHGFSRQDFEFPDVSYMYSTLSDNYTNYFSPALTERIMELLFYAKQQVGIGADFREVTTGDSITLVFKSVYPDGPASKAGFMRGDTLLTFDGIRPRNAEQVKRLEGTFDAGDAVRITAKRGEETIEEDVRFEEVITPTVFVDEIDSIPVITITEFTDTTYLKTGTYGEFMDALKETEGAEATIIDLRGNPGGSTEQCINMTSELLFKNDTIFSMIEHNIDTLTEKKYVDTTTYIADKDGLGAGRYFVFLADSGSASCAELMLVGTVSNTKSPIVGHTTYGKGIGQIYTMTYAGGLTGITSMRMLDKNGKTYHKYGIVPDFEEDDSDKAMQKAVELAKEQKAVRTAGYGTVDLGHFTLAKSQSGKTIDRGAFKFIPFSNKFMPKDMPLK